MRKPLFTGCGTALVTPFKNGEVDYEALDRLVEDQVSRGINALVAVGTTGEPSTLTWEEQIEVILFGKWKHIFNLIEAVIAPCVKPYEKRTVCIRGFIE